jgi:hypothetical protein
VILARKEPKSGEESKNSIILTRKKEWHSEVLEPSAESTSEAEPRTR